MHKLLTAAAGGMFLIVSAAAAAEPAPATSSENFVKAIQAAPCDNGYPRDEQGACYTVTDPDRGFSIAGAGAQKLDRSANSRAAGSSTATTKLASIERATAHAAQPKELSDLLITFKVGSAELTPDGKAQATAFAQALRDTRVAGARFEIGGHTDVTGQSQKNQTLSAARAEAVKGFLVAQGVDAGRLEAKGYGSSRLAAPDAPDSAANRRVEARRLD